ncbi:hypothetical protein Mapa_016228 [Marchantia paleacea]|nr:hypothetical protein Mapa_016228 [Marchantia paleacea]
MNPSDEWFRPDKMLSPAQVLEKRKLLEASEVCKNKCWTSPWKALVHLMQTWRYNASTADCLQASVLNSTSNSPFQGSHV